MKVISISAGLSNPSTSTLLTEMILSTFKEVSNNFIFKNYELKEYSVPIMNALTGGFASSDLQRMINELETADIVVLVTPIYKASISGLFKTFLDILDENIFEGKTVILGATGGSIRHSSVTDYAIRPIFNYMRANVVPTSLYASPEDWGNTGFKQRVKQAVEESLNFNNGKTSATRKNKSLEFSDFKQMIEGLKNV